MGDDITIIRQVDNLTITQAVDVEISARAQTNDLIIKDIENVISGAASPEINLIITRQSDSITIVRPVADSLVVKD